MKFLIFFGCILIFAKITLSDKSPQEQWASFKNDFAKKYDTAIEEDHRYKIFRENLMKIQKHNKKYETGQSTYFQGVTSFADKTFDEYLELVFKEGNYSWRGIINDTDNVHPIYTRKPQRLNTVHELDWSQKGAVTEVKNQGTCGSCYAFASIGALESAHWKQTGKLVRLSEQNIVDCAKPQGNSGCHGGMPYKVFNYIEENDGVATEESYPYENAEGKCRFKPANTGARVLTQDILKMGDEVELKPALENIGPLAVAIDAGYLSFQLYAGGVLFEPQCINGTALNHAVLLVGYGVQNGVKFWKIKNSFGKGWGDNGYVLLARDRNMHCGIGEYASSVVAKPDVIVTPKPDDNPITPKATDEPNSCNIFNQKFIPFNMILFTSLSLLNFFY